MLLFGIPNKMANEMILKVETHPAINFTSSTAIARGAVCKLSDQMTAALSDGDNDIFAGICKTETSTSDTSVALYRGGIFEATINGTCNAGDPLVTDSSTGGANKLAVAAVNEENVVGIALETATDEERILVEIRPMTMQLA